MGDLVLRGKTEALRAFEPLRDEQFRDPETKSYLDAFAKLEAADPGAIAGLAAHVGKQLKGSTCQLLPQAAVEWRNGYPHCDAIAPVPPIDPNVASRCGNYARC